MTPIETNVNWEVQKEILKQKLAVLSDNDFLHNENKKEEFLKKLQITLGLTKADLLKIFSTL